MTSPEAAHLERTAAEKAASAVLPAAALAWGAAEIMHLAAVPPADPGIGAALVTAVAWGAGGRREDVPAGAWRWAAAGGGWLTAADAFGPLAWWPAPLLTAAWIVFAFAASRAAHRHDAVASAREWRSLRAGWLEKRDRWGLRGTHLLDYRETRLGEWYLVSVKGTGKTSGDYARGGTAYLIAESLDLPESRVTVAKHGLAGRVEVSVRLADPWADPLPHPLAGGDPGELPAPYSIRDPAGVGADPETGRLLEIPLWGETGARNVNVVGIRGAGKTVILNNLSERVTAAADAVQVRVNLSVKGHAEAERWGPACHLTAFGPQQQARAVLVLRAVSRVIEWRAARYAVAHYEPSPSDPLIAVIIDESDSAMSVAALRKLADDIATKGREYGVALVRAGQRGTVDYGSAKIRSQDDVFVVGAVNRQGEARHAAGNASWALPDMAGYGEGRAGVWAVAELGAGHRTGRAWLLERADSARIAAERAFAQPVLHPDCAAFLGDEYVNLLATEVFTRWAHAQEDDSPPDEPGFVRLAAGPRKENGTGAGDAGSLEQMWEATVNDEERARIAALDAKLGGVRRMVAETAAMPVPDMPQEEREAEAERAWQQVGERAEIPAEALPVLTGLLGEGTTISAAARELGVSKWTARTWLENLRGQGVARVEGERRAARWRLAPPPDGAAGGD